MAGDGTPDLDCQDLLEQLGDYLDHEARQELCRAIEEHMHQCRDCRIVVDKTRKTILLYQADRSIPLPSTVTDRLQQALSREYRATGSGASGGVRAKGAAGDPD